jgi:heat shock protein HslJ
MLLLSACAYTGASNDRPLLDTSWRLEQLLTENIEYTGSNTPHLRFEAERVTGNDGCNSFFGPYKRDQDRLDFGPLASTRMACPHIADFDLVFNKMLLMTTGYRISSNRLELYMDDKLLASFIAAAQR